MTSLLQDQRNEELEIINVVSGDSDAVDLWRRHFSLNCNRGRKYDITVTVKDLRLWAWVLTHWGYWQKNGKWKSFNPLKIDHQLAEYERLESSAEAREIAGYQG